MINEFGAVERRNYEIWTSDADSVEDSYHWTGTTRFDILRPLPDPGFVWCGSRKVKHKTGSQRVPYILPEAWEALSRAQKDHEIALWHERRPKLEESRAKRGIGHCIQPADEDSFNLAISRAIDRFRRPAEPNIASMPTVAYDDVAYACAASSSLAAYCLVSSSNASHEDCSNSWCRWTRD